MDEYKSAKEYLVDTRIERIDAVVEQRTHNLVAVTEKITDTGNINACMRSAEAMGLIDFHVIEAANTFQRSGKRTSMGANKWLDIHRWQESIECIEYIKGQGLQLVVTALDDSAVPITEIDFSKPTAIVFGNEHLGASKEMIAAADKVAYIPMHGFVESFNISVACALSLYTAVLQRGASHADLSYEQKEDLQEMYYQRSAKLRTR